MIRTTSPTTDAPRHPATSTTIRVGALFALFTLVALAASSPGVGAQTPADVIGRWHKVAHYATFEGKQFDSYAALLQQRPCAAQIVYAIGADGTFRLDASGSACDESYRKAQERLYAKTKWKLEGNKFTTSATNFAVGQTYVVTVAGNKMTWVGTDGQGRLEFRK